MENQTNKRGGKRPGAGRKKGSLDRATVEQKATLEELARSYTDVAMSVLVGVAQASESDAARVAASNSILDRGYGKARQGVEHTGKDGQPIAVVDLSDTEAARRIAFTLAKATQPTTH